ncbi:hypothetical protein EWM64_g1293 [Hericium alpestre]|uniref:Protein kinase domain-containing protein n=1 Tax=Hericium alpestre TaxID=135208 RepID=A0A4Z0A8V6_9AGAM|nr:hypothetical protein EWM64_g1293 [Hericium alpestre]
MAPPALPLPTGRSGSDLSPPSLLSPDPQKAVSTSLGTPAGKAGFKPIGQANPAVKRFFPGDDDDSDTFKDSRSSPVVTSPRIQLPRKPPTTLGGFVPQAIPPQNDDRISKPSASPLQAPIPVLPPGLPQPVFIPSHVPPHLPPHVPPHLATHVPSQVARHLGQPHTLPLPIPSPRASSNHSSVHEDTSLPPERQAMVDITRPSTRTPQGSQPNQGDLGRPQTPTKSSQDELYIIVSQVGEGTFGKVYKARNAVNGLHVALKRIRMETERDGFPVTAMREIKLLQSLRHDNVVQLYEMMVSNGSVFMVFEYMDHDLTGILSQTQFNFTDAHLKSLCRQMLSGLAYLHRKGVIHRDIKGSNILVNNRGELKLGDFGLARFYQKRRRSDYTNRVITLWYRPPELLFGTTVYGPEVDMWSAGCIMLELFTKKPVFQGNDEIHQLEYIFKILGTPNSERWPGVTDLPWYELVKPKEAISNHFRDMFRKWLSPAGLDLAEHLLAYDPAKRATAVQALNAPYFKDEEPAPMMPVGLSTLEGEWHELETKRERAKKRRKIEGGGVA